MVLRRGFKTEANWYAREMRRELNLRPESSLCPWKLADHLGYVVSPLSEFGSNDPEAVDCLQREGDRAPFSAITLPLVGGHLIIYNDAHDRKRQAADISHELAHGLLIHKFVPLHGQENARHYDSSIEEEANWLGPALLISDEAALFIARRRMSAVEASDSYGVSMDLLRMRLNVSGAYRRVAGRAA